MVDNSEIFNFRTGDISLRNARKLYYLIEDIYSEKNSKDEEDSLSTIKKELRYKKSKLG